MVRNFEGDYETAEERDAAAEALGEVGLIRRVEAIEARQRADQQHDPSCVLARWNEHNADRLMAMEQSGKRTYVCDCWLAASP